MPNDDLRSRIEALNRRPLAESNRPERPAPAPWSPGEEALPTAPAEAVRLEDAVPGRVCQAPDGGDYYHVERLLDKQAPWTEGLVHRVRAALVSDALCARLRHPTGVPVDHALFLDVETLGLNTEPIFLAGTLLADARGLVCHQLLARTLDEEAAVLSTLAGMLAHARVLVTFNGIDFDLRLLRYRATRHGVAIREPRAHLDVLLEARRRYRGKLPNCRLQMLEEQVCGRIRKGDVPGAQIPVVYDSYMRTGDASMLAVVLQHNVLDLATTADLVGRFWSC